MTKAANRGKRNTKALAPLSDSSASCILDYALEGDGEAVSVHGNLTTATNIEISVPGLGTDARTFAMVDADARRIQRRSGSITAVIAWLGYNAPEINPSMLTAGRARDGANDLATT